MCVCVGVCWVHVCLHGNSINQHIDKVQFMVNQSFFNEWTNNTNNKRNVCNSSTQRYRMLQLLIYHWRVNVYTRYYAHLLVCIFILPAISNSCNIHMWQASFFRLCGIFVAATSFNNAGAYLHNCHATNATICVYWLPVMACCITQYRYMRLFLLLLFCVVWKYKFVWILWRVYCSSCAGQYFRLWSQGFVKLAKDIRQRWT